MNIEKCIENYCDTFYHDFWGINHLLTDEKILKQQAIDFLNQYAMNDLEYSCYCVPLMRKVFKFMPEIKFDFSVMTMADMIEEGLEYFMYNSSPLFWKESYELIQEVCAIYGDKNIFIVEEECCEKVPSSAFKIKIPVGVTWERVSNGGYITDVLCKSPNCNYYVCGDSGQWGKWCDYDNNDFDYETFCYKYETLPVLNYKAYFFEYLITESGVIDSGIGGKLTGDVPL